MDRSFKFGAGRYLQEQGLLERAGEEIGRFGRKPFIVGGPTAMGIVRERLSAGLKAEGLDFVMDVHPGQCCHEDAREWTDRARAQGCDLVVGVGGGRSMDFAKLCAHYLGTRVVNIPTCCSTCAPYA
ncbi:MAG TPA: iron-containing alcohol dehydrogenase, partial [Clostridia bacterium]|nr:iron-containing alcohol dehydrogenase [Clostridia bacterium]